ncbi:Virulence-associated V antigen [compost metagenome]
MPEIDILKVGDVSGHRFARLPAAAGDFAPGSLADELQSLMRNRQIVVVDEQGKALTTEQMRALYFKILPVDALRPGSASAPGFQPLRDDWTGKINAYAERTLPLSQLVRGVLGNPLHGVFAGLKDEPPREKPFDQDVIDAYLAAMDKNETKRSEIRDLLASLAAESKIFSIIQSEINVAMSGKTWFDISGKWTKLNLNDRARYGYATDEQWKGSAEYKLLSNLTTFPVDANGFMSIKDFLSGVTKPGTSGPQKESGVMDGLKDYYDFEKENNPLASFAGAVGDRARMVNDKVSQQTIILKDVTGRYDTAIESMNRFIEKFFNVLNETLRAV